MKIKKIVACLLTAAISSLVIFSGCNNNRENVQSSKATEEFSQSQSVQSSENKSSQPSSSSQTESSDTSASNEKITPAVWKVTDKDGNYIYMMGSIHAADKAVENMPDYFEGAFAQCTALAVEADITDLNSDISESIAIVKKYVYSDGTKISDHISKDTYTKAVQILKDNNVYNSLYDYYKPVMWTSLMDNIVLKKSGLDINYGVDSILTSRAKKDKKQILEVESVDYQVDLMTGFSDELQEMMLQSFTEDGAIDEQTESLKKLYNQWKKGTITEDVANSDFNESSMTADEKKLVDEYNTKMLVDRNKHMADKAEEYMQGKETVMFVVGAAHFYGENGVLQLMEDKGCTVKQLTSADVDSMPVPSKPESREETSTENSVVSEDTSLAAA